MVSPDERFRRWLDDEREAKRLSARRGAQRRRCDAALNTLESAGRARLPELLRELDTLERLIESSFAFYLRHVANDAAFLREAFGATRAREISNRLARRKVTLLAELDRVRETRLGLDKKVRTRHKKNPGPKGPGS